MSDHQKPKFTKVKIEPSLAYHDCEVEHKKNTPNPRITKLEQVEKEGIEVALQI